MQQPMLPCSIEAERCVLGALLIDPAALAEVAEFLKAGHFYRDAHRSIYEAMVRLYEHHQAADAITVCDELARTKTLDQVGGIAAVNALVSEVPTSGNVEEYARIVERTAIFRQLIAVGSEIAGRAYRQEENALDYAEEAIYRIGQGSLVKPISPHDEALTRYLSRLEDILEQSRSGVVSGVPTGYKYLDRLLGGLRPAKMIVLASRPGQGKTSLALNIASYAVKHGYQVLFFSLEMDEEELMQRWVAMEAALDSTKLRDARLDTEEEERVYQAISRLAALDGKLWLDDTCGLSVSAMRSKARRLQTQHGVDLIIMDYLQLGKATVEESRKVENRRLEVEAVSRGLKGLARELHVPVFALAQLSRAVESRADKVPQLSDLRETGAIEADSDVVMFIHKDDKIPRDAPEYTVNIMIEKHRSGPVGIVPLHFVAAQTRYSSVLTREG